MKFLNKKMTVDILTEKVEVENPIRILKPEYNPEYKYYYIFQIIVFFCGFFIFPIWAFSIFCLQFEDECVAFMSKINILLFIIATIIFFLILISY